jgi:hypothetical protein
MTYVCDILVVFSWETEKGNKIGKKEGGKVGGGAVCNNCGRRCVFEGSCTSDTAMFSVAREISISWNGVVKQVI